MYAFKNPEKIKTETEWIDWIFALKAPKEPEIKYALEFVGGWQGKKIAVLGMVPWVASCATAIIWSALWGSDIQTAFTVAAFILTASGSMYKVLPLDFTISFSPL